MLDDFKTSKQNFTDLRTMIEETQKPENETFGRDIVKEAARVKEARERKRPKKNFLAEHQSKLHDWKEVKQKAAFQRRVKEEVNHQRVVMEKGKLVA